MILVALGTQKLQFNRLLIQLDELVENGTIREEIFAQIGYSTYMPKHYPYATMLSYEEFDAYLQQADIVIAHGGTGTLVTALKSGKKVIAAPRLKKYGEHVDDHQKQIIEMFEQSDMLIEVDDMDLLGKAVADIETFHPHLFESRKNDMLNLIGTYLETGELLKIA
ncbi:MAG: beta(1,3)galactosyltransferase EpsH [Clostridiales Family XIII bacterium]|nr:beta(1,3)galactosyltransferase EpsH [Clostridiales Family XIII bacterium]